MWKWLGSGLRWTLQALTNALFQSTLYPLLHELAIKAHLHREDLEYHSESLSKRSKLVMNGLLASIGFAWTTSISSTDTAVLVTLIFLLWCIMNRMYYEGLPLDELQKRVQHSSPAVVAILYAIPEFYQAIFIAYQITLHGKWIGILLLIGIIIIQLVLRFCRVQNRKSTGKTICEV
ncbi:hypothetical protein DL96DRAFT_1685246 [Flagelloscypha sp. PMI_526]|nr:hypothetical protein DL96DRAFT_1685246 [Flagelloscypha sp. PMI_526]